MVWLTRQEGSYIRIGKCGAGVAYQNPLRPLLPDLQHLHLRLRDLQLRGQFSDAVRQSTGTEVPIVFLDHGGVRMAHLSRYMGHRNALVHLA